MRRELNLEVTGSPVITSRSFIGAKFYLPSWATRRRCDAFRTAVTPAPFRRRDANHCYSRLHRKLDYDGVVLPTRARARAYAPTPSTPFYALWRRPRLSLLSAPLRRASSRRPLSRLRSTSDCGTHECSVHML